MDFILMVKKITQCIALLFFSLTLGAQDDIELIELASGLDLPVDITHAGDDKLYIVEKTGSIKIFENGSLLSEDFLNIQSQVYSNQDETGLLGLAFHPDFATNRIFYVNYMSSASKTRISKFMANFTDPNTAEPNSEQVLMELDQPFANHNGGCIKFGPDGYLYIALGDGGWGGDPQDHGQNPESLLGKMLRIDVDNLDPGSFYGIPADNPFVNDPDTFNEIWATGLRNPWRFSFDSENGDLWIADVGQDDWEEINYHAAGEASGINYGWRCKEGFENYNSNNCNSTYEAPIFAYANNLGSGGCSVTGGFVYRGSEFPYFAGKYIYADFCTGRFWSISKSPSGNWVNSLLANLQNNEFSSFGEDINGELYVLAYEAGRMYKVTTQLTDTEDVELFSETRVFPNPTEDAFQLNLNFKTPVNCSIELFDLGGKLLLSSDFGKIDNLSTSLNIKEFEAGTYILNIYADSHATSKKIIKQ